MHHVGHTAYPRHSRLTRLVATLATLGVALLAALVPAVSAQAAPTVYIDQQFTPGGFSAWLKPATPYQVAQPFIPNSTGYGYAMSVYLADHTATAFVSAAIHEYPVAGTQVNATPITNGEGVVTLASTQNPDGSYTATVSFPLRPELVAGTRYALVINPEAADGSGDTVSFHHSLSGTPPSLSALTKQAGVWTGAFTGRLFFVLEMADARVPEVPAPEVALGDWVEADIQCDASTVQRTRTVTTTPYTLVAGAWVLATANATTATETGVRALAATEIVPCDTAAAGSGTSAGSILPVTGAEFPGWLAAGAGALATIGAALVLWSRPRRRLRSR